MEFEPVTWIGMIAGTLTTIAFFPQVVKTWRTKSTEDLSLKMYLIFITGISLWFAYGVVLKNPPMILSNIVTFLFAGTILYFKLTEKSRARRLADHIPETGAQCAPAAPSQGDG